MAAVAAPGRLGGPRTPACVSRSPLRHGHQRMRACLCAKDPTLDLRQLYTKQTYVPAPTTLTKVTPTHVPGKGVGLQAVADIAAGELIVLSSPLGVAYGPGGRLPSNQDLVRAICKTQLPAADLEWLRLLQGSHGPRQPGDSSRAEVLGAVSRALLLRSEADTQQQQQQQQQAAGPGDDTQTGGVLPEPELVTEAVSCNSYGETSEDIAVSTLREVDPLAFTGLWPELALVNHSCAPNTSQLMVGGAMLLRAARPIMEGDEVTTCYLGQARFKHAAARRAQLAASYGFHCQCSRCLVEHSLFPTRRYPASDVEEHKLARRQLAASSPSSFGNTPMGSVLQWVLDAMFGAGSYRVGAAKTNSLLKEMNVLLEGLETSSQDALTALTKSEQKQQTILQRVGAAIDAVELEVESLELSRRDQLMVLSSVGGLYRLRHELLEISAQGSPEQELAALRSWLDTVDAVARGSDIHMFLAVKYQAKVKAVFGAQSEESRQAELACAATHFVRCAGGAGGAGTQSADSGGRYGKVGPELVRELMQVRSRMAAGSAMASRISVMAWEKHKERAAPGDSVV